MAAAYTECKNAKSSSFIIFIIFYFFSFPQEHSPSVFIALYLRLVGGKSTVDTTSPLLTSNTLLQSWTWCINNIQYHERKEYFIEKMYPSECGRALKYITCKGKNGSSIIPKRDAEKWKLFYQPYYQKHQKYYAEGTTIEKDISNHWAFFQTNPNPSPQTTQEKQQTQPRTLPPQPNI